MGRGGGEGQRREEGREKEKRMVVSVGSMTLHVYITVDLPL